jgi:flagellar hook-associated protein 2
MSSVTSSTTSLLSAKTGMGGLVSGMDIDELVSSLTATSREKILKQEQNIQKYEWKQESYRTISTALKEFQTKYFDLLSKTNLRSPAFFKTVASTATSDAVSVSASASATAGTMVINSITQLATSQKFTSKVPASQDLVGTVALTDMTALEASLKDKSILMNLDGQARTITFDQDFFDNPEVTNSEDFRSALQDKIDSAFGVSGDADRVIEVGLSAGDNLSFTAAGSTLSLSGVGSDTTALDALGFTNGQSNKIRLSSTLQDLSLATPLVLDTGTHQFKINDVEFSFSKDETLSAVINRINASEAGVTLSYSSITDKFTMTAKATGSGDRIVVSETNGNFLSALGLNGTEANTDDTKGTNAILNINGQEVIRTSNTINIDGIDLTLNKTTSAGDPPITVNTVSDTTQLMEPVKKFVEDYNTLIESLNKAVKETVYRDFPPLSDQQKEEMNEEQIKKWEEKARSGMLRGDSLVRGLASKFQESMAAITVNGVSLSTFGITSAGYNENGKLKLDEDKLQKALTANPQGFQDLFTADNGLSNTLNGFINEAIKTNGPKGTRGYLTEMAGVSSTTSDTENSLADKIKASNEMIRKLQVRLEKEETRLWSRFTAMEKAIQQLNNQSSYIAQFSGNAGY